MVTLPVEIPRELIAAFCDRIHVRKLSLFGSVLTDRFGDESDIDMLVEFEPESGPACSASPAWKLDSPACSAASSTCERPATSVVLGEAAANISPEYRESVQQIPWAKLRAMRNSPYLPLFKIQTKTAAPATNR
jgi:Nucleotidyltransferase domain